jgi:hypothetical protein
VIVRLSRSGGFGGVRRAYAVDTAGLAPEDAAALEAAVAEAFAAPLGPPGGGADRFHYEVVCEDDGGARSLRFREAQAGDAQRAVVALVQELSERA